MNPELQLPFSRDPGFVEPDAVVRCLGRKGITILHGQSGTGKTHIALEHAYRCQDKQPVECTVWLSSQGFWRLELSIKTAAQGLLIHRSKIDGLLSFILWYTSRSHSGESLLILDGLSFEHFPETEERVLVEFLNNFDPNHGRVLITTSVELPLLKLKGLELSKLQLIRLNGFSKDEARLFLGNRLFGNPWTDQETSLFMSKFQNLPFALELITAFWSQCVCLEGKQDLWQELKANIARENASNALGLVLRSSIDQAMANNDNTRAYRVLCSMSFLDPYGVPLPLLYGSWRSETGRHSIKIRRAIKKLSSLSLIRQSSDGYQCSMNGPTLDYILKYLQLAETLESYQRDAVHAVCTAFSEGHGAAIVWETAEVLIPHIHQVLMYDSVHGQSNRDRIALSRALAAYRERSDKYAEAVSHYRTAWNLTKELYGETDLRTMEVCEELAYALYMDDKQEAAAQHHRQIEAVYADSLPPDSYRRLLHSGQYGSVLLEQCKWAEAEPRLLDGLAGSKKLYDGTNLTITTGSSDTVQQPQLRGGANKHAKKQRNDLSRLYSLTGRVAEAQVLIEESIALAKADGLAETHPYIFRGFSDLAVAYIRQGRVAEGLELHSQAERLAEASTECTPAMLFNVRRGHAMALSTTGYTIEAVEVQRRLLTVCPLIEATPGWQTRDAHIDLGISLDRLGQYKEAQGHFEAARKLCGPGKSDKEVLLQVRNSLALLYLRLGRLEEAEKEYKDLVQAQRELHAGDDAHADVLLVLNNYGGVLQRQKRYAEALKVQQDVFDKAVPRPNESEAMWSRTGMFGGNNLAESYRLWAEENDAPDPEGMLKKAEEIHRKVLEQREKQFGEVWPTWTSRVNIGMVLQAQGKTEQARNWYADLEKLAGAVGEVNATVKMTREKLKSLVLETR